MRDDPGVEEERRHLLLLRLNRHRARAQAVLWVERVWPALWPPLGVLGAAACLALLDVAAWLPAWLHAVLLAALGLTLCALLWRGVARLRSPSRAEADRRLEAASGLRHRPLAALLDTPSAGGDAQLWQAHVARAAAQVGRLRTGWPRPGLARRDPRALRAALVLAVVACAVIANAEAPGRLLRALSPDFAAPPRAPATQLQAWITPPGYTGLPPVFLRPETPAVAVPAGSRLTASLSGGAGEPELWLNGQRTAFKALDAGSFQVEATFAGSGTLSVRRGGATLGEWQVTAVPDRAPEVAFPEPPGGERGEVRRTRLPWQARHAYGIVSLRAELRLRDRPDAPPLVVEIPLPGGAVKEAHGVRVQDLTASPWAGLPVTARLVARDAPGLAGSSEDAQFTLPERAFGNPVARMLMVVRKQLTVKPDDRLTPLRLLDRIAGLPDVWDHDAGAFLTLRATGTLLFRQPGADAVEEAQRRLWDLALHLEEGAAEQTARALRQARDAVRQALQAERRGEKTDPAELDRRTRELADAVRRHAEALAEQARRDPGSALLSPEQQQLAANRAQRLAEQLRADADRAQMDAARRDMAELDQTLDDMDQTGRPEHGKMSERQKRRAEKRQRGQQQLGVLQDVVKREGGILDHSQARVPQAPDVDAVRRPFLLPHSPNAPQDALSGLLPGVRTPDQIQREDESRDRARTGRAQQDRQERERDHAVQSALRHALGEMMQQYGDLTGDVPPSLSEADRAMSDAGQDLADGRDQSAAGAAQRAIEALQKGGQSMGQQLSRMFGTGGQSGEDGDQNGDGEDADGGDQPGTQPGQGGSGGDQYGFGWGPPPRAGRGPADRRADDRRDPLGRPLQEDGQGMASDNGRTEVPTDMERTRTRDIQQELRDRAADRSRPQPELDYINRLLEQF